jgi:predicted RNA-binding protein YlxR (DUF448 family)
VSKKGHRPQRSCLGCGRRDEQGRLIRLVAVDQTALKIDKQANGRGGYLHAAEECWQAFVRRKSLHRAFRVNIDKDAKNKLVEELKQRYLE